MNHLKRPCESLKLAMKIMMNLFCGMVDQRKAFSLISSRVHCQRPSPPWISDTPRAGFEPAQNLSSGFIEWSCAVVITTTPRHQKYVSVNVYHKCVSVNNKLCEKLLSSLKVLIKFGGRFKISSVEFFIPDFNLWIRQT